MCSTSINAKYYLSKVKRSIKHMRENMVKDIEKYVKSPGYFKKEDFKENIQAKLRSFEGQLIKKMR